MGYRDVTPEELAMLNATPAPQPKAKSRWRDVTAAEQSMLDGDAPEDQPYWLNKGAPKPAGPGDTPYPKADIAGAKKSLQASVDDGGKPTRIEALARGGMQGGTAGFADELTGVGGALGEGAYKLLGRRDPSMPETSIGDAYRTDRDEHRARDKAAQEAHPTEFIGGEVIGSALAPLPGPKGATLIGKATRAAGEGALFGAGASEADNAKDLGWDALKGAGASAATSTVLHGAAKLGEGATKRVQGYLTQNVLEGVPAGTQDKALTKLGGKAGMVAEMGSSKPLADAAKKGPAALAQEVGAQMDEVGGKLGEIYKHAPDVPLANVKSALEQLKAHAVESLDAPRAAAIEREIASLEKMAGGREVVKAESVHNLVRRYGRGGFEGGSFNNPSDAKQLGRDMYGAVTNVLQEHVEATGGASKAAVKKLNAQYSKLSAWDDLATAGAQREQRAKKPGLTEWAKRAAGAYGLYSAGKDIENGQMPSWSATIPLAVAAARPLGRGADVGLSVVHRFLSAGGDPAVAVRKLMESGVSRESATATVQAFGSGSMK